TASSGQPSHPLVVSNPDFDLDVSPVSQAGPPPSGGFWGRLFGRRTGQVIPPPPVRQQPSPSFVSRQSRDLPRDRLHFDRLDGTRAEGERIAALLGVQPWQGSDALEGPLKERCRSPRILHLATHGFFLEDQKHDPNQERRDLGVMGECRLSGPLPENPQLR